MSQLALCATLPEVNGLVGLFGEVDEEVLDRRQAHWFSDTNVHVQEEFRMEDEALALARRSGGGGGGLSGFFRCDSCSRGCCVMCNVPRFLPQWQRQRSSYVPRR